MYGAYAQASCDADPASCAPQPVRPLAGDPANTRMSDGRHFTDWTPKGSGWMTGAVIPHPVLADESSPALSSHDMKDRLVREGERLMEADRAAAAAAVSRTWCDALQTLPGFETEQECGEFSCKFASPADGAPLAGHGIGRAP
jgi:hypothetical protein